MNLTIDNEKILHELNKTNYARHYGKVSRIVGLTIESIGPLAKIGELCIIYTSQGTEIFAEVVGFKDNNLLLMPLGDMSGIGINDRVEGLGKALEIKIDETLLGRVVDGLGNIIDDKGELNLKDTRVIIDLNPNSMM